MRWDPAKSKWLKRTRGLSFEEIVNSNFVGIGLHPRRSGQMLMFFELDGYIWVVPCVKAGGEVFLKTAFPSRSYTKKWLHGELK